MLIFDTQGHEIIAKAMKNMSFKMLLTDGGDEWTNENIPLFNGEVKGQILGLVAEHEKSYVKVDEDGDIEFNETLYARSVEPTKMLLLSFKLKGFELEGMKIRQQIVVSGSEVADVSQNMHFIPHGSVITVGKKLFGENIAVRSLEAGSSEVINVIVTF